MNKKHRPCIPVMLTMAFIICGCSDSSPILTPASTPLDASKNATPETRPQETPGNPPPSGKALADDEVMISSYPPGAQVYVVPATVDIYDLKLEDVTNQDNLLGTTPLTHSLSPGSYYVIAIFTPDLFDDFGYNLPVMSDPTFDDAFPFDGNPSQSMSFIDGEYIESFTKIYRLIKDAGRSEALISIALPLPQNQRGQQKPALYPTLATVDALPASYSFDTATVERAIEDNLKEYNLTSTVDSTMISEMIDVLLRVGKVKLDTSDIDIIIHMHGTDTNSFSITAYGS